MQLLKQSSTARPLVFKMYDSADHVSAKTGLSPTVVISKNGGSFASPSGAVSEIGNGYYKVAGNATDTNTLGTLALYATASGADPADMGYNVVAYDPDVTNLAANVTQFGGTNGTFSGGRPEVNTTHLAGTSQTARDIGASVLLSSGTGTGQISLSSGAVLLQPTQTGVTIPTVTTLTNAPSDSSGVTTLLSRVTSTRAGYWDNLSGGAVALASGVTVTTNNDKSGYSISGTTTTLDALQTALNSAHGAGSWATATGFSTHSAADVWAAGTRTLTAGTNIQLPSNGLANITAWTVAITGNITGSLSGSVGSVTTAVTLPTIPANWITAAGMATDASAEIADAVWDEAQSGHTTNGTFGKYLDGPISGIESGGGGSGSGAYAITVTVTDGTDPLQNALVRVREGANTFTATTDASGEADFSLDAATYEVTITKGGYAFTPTTRTVTGNQAGTLTNDLEMSLAVITPSDDPAVCVVGGSIVYITGAAAANIRIKFEMVESDATAASGNIVAKRTATVTTDSDGEFTINLLKGYTYSVTAEHLLLNREELVIGSEDTYAFSGIVS